MPRKSLDKYASILRRTQRLIHELEGMPTRDITYNREVAVRELKSASFHVAREMSETAKAG